MANKGSGKQKAAASDSTEAVAQENVAKAARTTRSASVATTINVADMAGNTDNHSQELADAVVLSDPAGKFLYVICHYRMVIENRVLS